MQYVNLIVVVYYDRQDRRLCAHPFLEIYREGQIHFMAPLARQGDFYVPEVRRVERRLLDQEESHSDSDVSGTCTSCCTAWGNMFYLYSQVNVVGFKALRTTGLPVVAAAKWTSPYITIFII